MSGAISKTQFLKIARQYWPRILVVITIFFVVAVRVHLREMPLERDEGEYAYAGQLILEGIPPYKLACNMKLPGTYAAYAVIMAVLGQSPSGIHLGLALVNAASILLVFLLGRKLLDEVAGAAAAVVFALMALSPSVLGLAAHATHFVVLPMLGGCLWLLAGSVSGQKRALFFSGLLFGLAFVMKQHGALFGAFGLIYLVWVRVTIQKEEIAKLPKIMTRDKQVDYGHCAREAGVFVCGLALPYLCVCLVLWWSGVFPQFFFWTIEYARKYISVVPMYNRAELFRYSLNVVTGPSLLFWFLAILGMILMWGDRRLRKKERFFLSGWLLFSCLSISIGFYFREHYFILLLPVLSMLAGMAVSRSAHLLKNRKSAELFIALPGLALFLIGTAAALVLNGEFWFGGSPDKVCRQIYGDALFSDAVQISKYVETNTPAGGTVAVMGSEPEIYFYSRRHSATSYIYVYSLMEPQAYASEMQEQMIREIETNRPECMVYVDQEFSWLRRPESKARLFNWWEDYRAAHYELARAFDIETEKRGDLEQRELAGKAAQPASGDVSSPSRVLVFKRRANR